MATAWNLFVKKIYHEGKKGNPDYQFKDALKDASRRKGEMGSQGSKSMKSKKCCKCPKKGTRKRRGTRRH